jgi:small subunit ribosomal protein S8|tara:strand:+ start:32 stop:424 length:393 start_codon:yes stop_codon:yes gene_type:complete
MTDPIADMITRIRNANSVDKRFVDIPSSILKKRIAFVLKSEKYIEDFIFIKDGQKNSIRIFLKYSHNGKSVITGIDRVSKPGRRVFVGCKDMPRVLDGLGVSIISTSKGVLSNRTASKFGIGGEVLFNIW